MTAVRVVGTAGHVDHGKSTLIRALTGIDPDRLPQEKERGMTIDLGFAHARLASGVEVGFVDVPGHQDFIRNMLAGVGAIDAALLVVAADEGVMPQTREHLAILGLLGIEQGVVALAKRDLVDDEWAALVRGEVQAALHGGPLAGAPLVEVSASSGAGLEALRAALEEVLGATPARRDLGRARLPVDRVFTMPGFGTVVTGTLIDGALRAGEEVEVVPGGARGRVRGLQTHRRAIAEAPPGGRVAVNVSGLGTADVSRGSVLVRPGSLAPASVVGLRLAVLDGASGPLHHDERVKVHLGTAEVMARVSVLEGREIAPGEAGWAQLRLSAPVAVAVGDRLVIRRPSPSETVGGGIAVDLAGARLRRRADAVAALERRAAPAPERRLLAALDEPRTPAEAGERSGLGAAERDAAAAGLLAGGELVALADAWISRSAFAVLALRLEAALARLHASAPLRPGLPRAEARALVGLGQKRFEALVAGLAAEGRIAERRSALALPGHRPALTPTQERAWAAARQDILSAPLQPPSLRELEQRHGLGGDVVAALVDRGELVRVGGDAAFLAPAVLAFGERVVEELAAARTITVARARDLTGSSRKHVLPLLLFLDDHGVTRRVGDDRVLIHDPPEARARLARAIQRPEEAP